MYCKKETDFSINGSADISLPTNSHKNYCNLSIIEDMIRANDKDEAKKVLDERVPNRVATDWNYKI